MAYPPAYTRTFSFTDWETTHPGEPKPGPQLDNEYDNVSNALTATQDALALIQRADGALANDSVGVDQLQDDVFDGIVDGITADAEAAADAAAASAALAAGSAAAADASADAAAVSAATASGAAAQAGVSQGIAQDAANEAALSADEAEDSATNAANSASQAQGFRDEAGMHEELAFDWAEKLEGPVMPAPPGWPEAVDDGMFSSKWWAIRAREYNSVSTIDLGTAGADIGEAFDIWDAIPGNDLPLGLVYATWGTPPNTYVLTDPSDPSDPASWTNITGPVGPQGPPGAGGLADPTALVGLTAIPGVSTAGMRADAAPALDQAIAPTWTGAHNFNALVNLAGPLQANSAEGISGHVLASQGAGLPPIWRTPGGGAIELGWNFSSAVGTANPGSQKMSLNSALHSGVNTAVFNSLAFTNFDANTILSLLRAGNRIYMQQRNDASKAALYEVTGTGTNLTGYWTIPVSVVNSVGTMFPNNADINVVFIMSASSSPTFADPTGTVGLAAVNGALSTAMRSDAAPPLSQAIVPTWTGQHTFAAAGSLTAYFNGTIGRIIDINSSAANGPYVTLIRSGTPFADFGNAAQVGGTLDGFGIATRGATPISFARSGGTLSGRFAGTGEFQVIDGTAALPSFTFINDPNTGLYSFGADSLGLAVGGTFRANWTTGIHTLRLQVQCIDGTSAVPAYSFENDPDTGWYRPTTNTLLGSAGGAPAFGFDASAVYVAAGHTLYIQDGTAAAPGIRFDSDSDTGMYRLTTNAIGFSCGGTFRGGWDATAGGFYNRMQQWNQDGSAAAPSYSFEADTNTGVYSVGTNQLGISADGARVIHIVSLTTSGMTVRFDSGQIGVQNGTAVAPAYSFVGDPDTGIYRAGTDTIGFAAAGVAAATLSNAAMSIGVPVSAPSFTSTSARAIKRETGAPRKASDILARLRPLLYRLLDGDDREQLGLIAEEVHEVCPQLSDGKSVAYDRLAILLLAAWQDDHAEAA
jgi:hypothetical protein